MCHYIKLVLPAEADLDALRQIVERYGRVLEPSSEPRVSRELTVDERAYLTTAVCDCGTELATRRDRRREHHEGREVARLRRSGWSESKIRRWREQRTSVVARKAEAKAKSRVHEVEQWRSLVTELLDAKVNHVGLLVHWVTDSVRRGPVFSRGSLNTDTLASLEENVLYTFARRP